MDISQEKAKELFINGAILLFLDVPEGTEFGIDLKSWETGENFKGVKMIPPGLHYVHYSAISKYNDVAPRTGFAHFFKKSELLIMKWDDKNESISKETISDEQIQRYRDNLKNIDKFLGPYSYDILEQWKKLINFISEDLLSKLVPKSGEIRSALELVVDSTHTSINRSETEDINKSKENDQISDLTFICPTLSEMQDKQYKQEEKEEIQMETNDTSLDKETKNSSKVELPESPSSKRKRKKPGQDSNDDDLLPNLKPIPGTELRFTKIPDKNYPDGATPSEITKHSLDNTYVLECLLKHHKNMADFIGELQFSFICFLIGHSLDAFEHWKRLVNIICSCQTAISKYRTIYDLFLTVIETQLNHAPIDFLADIVSNNNFVFSKLRQLFYNIDSSDKIDDNLKAKAENLKFKLMKRFEWDLSGINLEDDDDAPVIVKL